MISPALLLPDTAHHIPRFLRGVRAPQLEDICARQELFPSCICRNCFRHALRLIVAERRSVDHLRVTKKSSTKGCATEFCHSAETLNPQPSTINPLTLNAET